jgi:hypothetical protein
MKARQKDICLCVLLICLDSEDPPPIREFEEPVHYCEEENLYLVIGCDSN